MRIWIFNHYAEPPDRQATRSYDLGAHLVRRGHEVTIFAAGFSHYRFREEKLSGLRLVRHEHREGVEFVWLRTIPYHQNDWRRAGNMLSFAALAVAAGLVHKYQPQAVIGVSVHPLAALAAYIVARVWGARFFFEVTDLWPETLIEFGTLEASHPVAAGMRWLERFLYSRAYRIIGLLPGMGDYLHELGLDRTKVVWIPNGVDLSRYSALAGYDGQVNGSFRVFYVGGHVVANALEVILDAARLLQERGVRDVGFVFVGGGQEKPRLVERAQALSLGNVEFRDTVPKADLAAVLADADAFIFSLRDLPLYRYGISLNKMCDYLAGGRPIIFAGRTSYDPVSMARAGVTVPPEDPQALADAIEQLVALPPEARAQMGANGRAFVRQYHDIARLADRLDAILHERRAHAPAEQ